MQHPQSWRKKWIVWKKECSDTISAEALETHTELQSCSELSPLGQGLCSPALTSLWMTWAMEQGQFQKRSGGQVRKFCGPQTILVLQSQCIFSTSIETSYFGLHDRPWVSWEFHGKKLYWLRIPAQHGECHVTKLWNVVFNRWTKWSLYLVRWNSSVQSIIRDSVFNTEQRPKTTGCII